MLELLEPKVKYDLPAGVHIQTLVTHKDSRGSLMELYRKSWLPSIDKTCIQWNFFSSAAGVMRGVHVHKKHTDYLVVITGKMLLGLRDIRTDSPTNGMSFLIELTAEQPKSVLIPPGVMHGFYYKDESLQIIGVNAYWDPADEMGCQWNDPDLGIDWPSQNVIISDKDKSAPPFKSLMNNIGTIPYKKSENQL